MGYSKPWQRFLPNSEYSLSELRQFRAVERWRKDYLAGHRLGPVSMYVLPADRVDAHWKAEIARRGYNFFGLSGLQSSPLGTLIGLTPEGFPVPKPFVPIEVQKAQKTVVYSERVQRGEYALVLEEWDYLPSDWLYVRVPHEKRDITKLLMETVAGGDLQLARSLQSPLFGAPPAVGGVGGISLSSLFGRSPFAVETLSALESMLPPEYRATLPPRAMMEGARIEHALGISFRVAERPLRDRHLFRGLAAQDLPAVSHALIQRRNFGGELSVVSMISPAAVRRSEVYTGLLRSFTDAEITLPFDLDELMEADVDVRDLRKVSDENVMLEIVDARQRVPSFSVTDAEMKAHNERIGRDVDALLVDELNPTAGSEFVARTALPGIAEHTLHVAQSLARSARRDVVRIEELGMARDMAVNHLRTFIANPIVRIAKERAISAHRGGRIRVLEAVMNGEGAMAVAEVWDVAKASGVFNDLEDVQGILDWAVRHNLVIRDSKGRYVWV